MTGFHRLVAGVISFFVAVAPAFADDIADFYKGRNVTLFIGSAPGGGYDLYGRLFARYLGNYIPGNPNIISVNMPGAGQTRVSGHVALVAPKDGTAIAIVSPLSLLSPILGGPKIQYDPTKFYYLGSATREYYACAVRSDAPVTNFKDLFERELIVGGSTGTTRQMPGVLNAVLGTRFKLVSGYPGTKDVLHAIERNEVQGLCGLGYMGIALQNPDWVKNGFIKFIVQEGTVGFPELTKRNVPLSVDFAKTAEARQVLELIYTQAEAGRPFVAAGDIPQERAAALRQAFGKAMRDPKLIADAAKYQLELEPLAGEELQAIIERAYAAPPEIKALARKASAISASGD